MFNKKNITIFAMAIFLCTIASIFFFSRKEIAAYEVDTQKKIVFEKNKKYAFFFWSPTCHNSQYNLLSLNQLKEVLQSYDIELFLILPKDEANIRGRGRSVFIQMKINEEMFYDENNAMQNLFNIKSYPTLIIIEKNYKVIFEKIGYCDWKNHEEIHHLNEILKTKVKK